MLIRAFAGFHGLLMVGRLPARMDNALTKQALSRIRGGAYDEHSAMLFRTFAVYIKLGRALHHRINAVAPLRRVDVSAFALAAALTAAMLVPFLSRVGRVRLAEDRIPQLVFIPFRSSTSLQPITPPSSAQLPRSPSAAFKRSQVQALPDGASITLPPQEPAATFRGEIEVVASPVPAASAPLRLDPEVLREAYRASKSALRQMGESSGAYLGEPAVSREEQLARAVARTEKSDCLRPGGSLLSALVVAYELLREQCK